MFLRTMSRRNSTRVPAVLPTEDNAVPCRASPTHGRLRASKGMLSKPLILMPTRTREARSASPRPRARNLIHRSPSSKAGALPVSVSLDFLVHYTGPNDDKRIGGLLFAFSKRSEPKQTQSVARYERLARHASAMIHMHLTDHFSELGKPSPKHCLWIDNHLQRAHRASGDYKTLVADMKVAGDRIAKEWAGITPPEGFDPKHTRFVK